MSTRQKLTIAAAGLGIGLALGFLLPAHWIFVEAPHSGHADHATGDTMYACPMFCTMMDQLPEDHRCPVCGMEMTPVSGRSSLDRQERRSIGLESERLRRVALTRAIRIVGEVDYDETRLTRITTRMSGWLEKVWADTTWVAVARDEKLASIYSPELYAAQREFLVAATDPKGGLLHAARRRLELLGIHPEDVDALARDKTVRESLILRAPQAGVIIERHAVQGASVPTGAVLYRIADLSRVWVQAEVFERELSWVFRDQPVRLQADGSAFGITGRVAFIDPVIDRRNRTARVRIEVDNPAGPDGTRLLRIGARVDAWIESRVDGKGNAVPPGTAIEAAPLAVPRTAVLSTGRRRVIYLLFVEQNGVRDYRVDPGSLPAAVFYQMVPVRLGPLAAEAGRTDPGLYPLLDLDLSTEERAKLQLESLEEGMTVVTRGSLLLDSQAQLSGKPSLLFPEGSRGSTDPHAGH